MILGRYAPRILAITTPGFEFNQLFTAPESIDVPQPSAQVVREGGYLDPTGRTQRVFRHHDHKFEWTRSEFREWCTSQALAWGYKVEISGVGRSIVRDPWGRDEPNGPLNEGEAELFASQTAVFTRILGTAEEHRRIYEGPAVELMQQVSTKYDEGKVKHTLFAHCTLQCRANQSSLSNEAILEEVKGAITKLCDPDSPGEAEIWDIWNVDAVALACGGSLDRLYEALETVGIEGDIQNKSFNGDTHHPHPPRNEWMWIQPDERTRWTRRIRWNGYVRSYDDETTWKSKDLHAEEPKIRNSGWEDATPEAWEDVGGWGTVATDHASDVHMGEGRKIDDWGFS